MRVTFTKVDDRRYTIAIAREHGPALMPRFGPGYDDLMPHDLAHFLVEEYYEIALGVWGQLAAGGGGIFSPLPEENSLHVQRRVRRIGAVGRADMARSEQLVAATVGAWEQTIGRIKHQTAAVPIDVEAAQLNGAVTHLGVAAGRWSALPYGRSMTLAWPQHLTLDPSKSRRGRSVARRRARAVRR